MGKKIKTGKQRKDKYYHLAKEAGFRSRAAFKLVQLNKRFEFLQTSQKVVDLCAAPGGWLQVASQNMPVSSICIGVDLVPIKPISKCITIQGDIREEKTRQLVRKELQRTDADCVLHDGAPNVGLNWAHDAFQQNVLTLYALRLTTQILKRNGYFVTKVFRSADYLSLINVFKKLFKRVHVWKPEASRLESAEIFVVCEKYLKPEKVDSDLLDVKKVFEQQDEEPIVNPIRMLTNKKEKKKKAEGYEEGDITQFHDLPASEFILSANPLEMLSRTSCITINEERFDKSCHTNDELRECIKDIKVCGPAELRSILQWRKKILADIKKQEKENAVTKVPTEEEAAEAKEIKELEQIDELIRIAQANEKSSEKKKKRKLEKARAKVTERKKYDMIHENDAPIVGDDMELFSLNSIRRLLERRQEIEENIRQRKLLEEEKRKSTKNKEEDEEVYECDNTHDENGVWETQEGNADETKSEIDQDDEEDEQKDVLQQNLLTTEETYMSEEQKAVSRSDKWFSKINDLLSDEDDDDEESHFDAIAKHMKGQVSKTHLHKNTVTFDDQKSRKRKADRDEDFNDDDMKEKPLQSAFEGSGGTGILGDDDESVDSGNESDVIAKKRPKKLTAQELALGEQMIYSKKKAENLEEWAYNRYTNNDPNLPNWFVEDERKHYCKNPPVAKKRVEYYMERDRELNVRPIKKVLEANARKQKRKLRRMAKAKRRAENVLQNENMEEKEKIREMKKIYKRVNKPEKKEIKYQVTTKGKRGGMSRPKGPYRVVDKRLKKDKRGMKNAKRAAGKSGGSHSRSKPPRTGSGGRGRK